MNERVRKAGSSDTRRYPSRDAKIILPGLFAEFAALDLDRLLPAEILRLLVG
jgi:hypothetical protein